MTDIFGGVTTTNPQPAQNNQINNIPSFDFFGNDNKTNSSTTYTNNNNNFFDFMGTQSSNINNNVNNNMNINTLSIEIMTSWK